MRILYFGCPTLSCELRRTTHSIWYIVSFSTFWSRLLQEIVDQHGFPSPLCMSSISERMSQLKSLITVIVVSVQITFSLPLVGLDSWPISPARAILYSPDTKIPRTGELALRKAIPANANMKAIQVSINELKIFLGSLNFLVISVQTVLPLTIGHAWRYIIPIEDSTEKTLWNNGRQCEESFEGIYCSPVVCLLFDAFL